MRYLLLASTPAATHHPTEQGAAHVGAAVAFCAQLEDELAASSELEWSEGLAPRHTAKGFDPYGSTSEIPDPEWELSRVWAVRVAGAGRADELAERIASELGARVEVRECLAGAQRP